MAGKLSFSIAINLLTENFKRGTSSVKNGLRTMQMQVLTFAAALGAGGIGLTDFVTRLIDVARETSRVTTALKNVSGGMGQFADNQRFLLDMAKKYGLEINALTGNFAKFTAASQVSGMSMANQRKIFESVSRACTAFGMSADESNGVLLALSQMMSKGKISSEELRLQMGERLPVALQAMAKAAGVSVGGLDKLMKQGKLMSADVLPKFADALNEMIPNVDTDNLETSINRLKNAFTEFSKGTNVQNAYKGFIDWLTKAVQSAGENIKGIVNSVIAFIIGASLGRLFKWIVVELAKSQRAAMVAASKSAKAAGIAFDEVAWKAKSMSATVSMAFSRMGKAIKAAFMSALPAAILIIVGELIARFVTLRQEAKRIGRIFSDYKAEAEKVVNTQDVIMLKEQLSIMNDKKQSQENINGAQAQLQKMLGVEHKSQEELNKLVGKRVKLLEEAARAQFHAGKIPEIEEKNRELAKGFKEDYGGNPRYSMNDMLKTISRYGYQNKSGLPQGFRTKYGLSGSETGIRYVLNEYLENLRSLEFSKDEIKKSTIAANGLQEPTLPNSNDPAGPDSKKSALQKAEEKYARSLRELDAQKEIDKMTDVEYNKAVDELGKKMLIEAKSSGDKDILNSEYIKMLEDVIDHPLYNKTQAELEKVEKEYTDAVELAKAKLDKKLITEDEYRQALVDAATSAANSAISIDGIKDSADGFIKKMQGVVRDNLKTEMPKRKQKDTTFDYKETDIDKTSDNLDIWIEYRDNLKDKLKETKDKTSDVAKSIETELNVAIANVDSLDKALKLAQVKEDIKNFSKELDQMSWDGFKGAVSNIDGMVSAFQRLQDAFDPESEATEWERLMAVWNMMTSVVDGMMSIIKTIEGITELTNKLTKAKEEEIVKTKEASLAKVTEATMDTTVTGVKVANSAIKETADKSAANTAVTTATTEIAANTAEGVSAAGASAASLPFPANIIAIGAAIAAAVALFASIPKFATGGIVGGNSPSGDKILARLNSGEMVLNKGQQSRLGEAIDSARNDYSTRVVVGGSVEVRGDKMELAINNSRRKQGKKPIS